MTEHWIWLTELPGLGPVNAKRLLRRFGSPEAIYAADASTLRREGLGDRLCEILSRKDLSRAEEIRTRCREGGIRVLHLGEADYPARLRVTVDAPTVLYCIGRLPDLEKQPCIGLVGARAANDWGRETALRLGWQVAGCGAVVVTGMARGVDAAAANGALDRGAPVLGILGGGVDVVYPQENRALFLRVAEQGCLLSEYPPGTAPDARHFPARNRIISALSDGVVVVQAKERSGALITARWAADQGRDVFAVPGPAGEALSRGCNQLLREGALLAECGWDVLREYEYRYPTTVREYHGRPHSSAEPEPIRSEPEAAAPDLSGLTPLQCRIVEALLSGSLQLDLLIDELNLPASQVLAQMTLLEIRGVVRCSPGKIYALQRKTTN